MKSVGRDVASTRKPPSRDSAVMRRDAGAHVRPPGRVGMEHEDPRLLGLRLRRRRAQQHAAAAMASRVAMRTMSQDTSIWSIIAFS